MLQVHDELIFELPRAELGDLREITHRLMPSLDLAVPLEIDEKVGRTWGDLEALRYSEDLREAAVGATA
ncbi:DNA polymerase I [compost metagenome]